MTPEGARARRRSGALPISLALLLISHSPPASLPEGSRAAEPEKVAGKDRIERRLVDEVSPDRAVRTVRALVAFGPRMGGTPSGDRAAAYVRSRLEGIGLDVEEILDPSKDTHEEPAWEARVTRPEALALEAWPIGNSPSLPATDLRILPAAPPEGEPPSPWALLTAGEPAAAASAARKAGARAVLTDFPREEGRYLDWAPATEIAGKPADLVPGFTLSLESGRKIRKWIGEGREVLAHLLLESHVSTGRPRTIVGTLKGTLPGTYLVCAHGDSDSGGPGADDNASGVATVLEAAASLAKAASEGLLPAARPSVRFVVWGSEGHSPAAYVHDRPGEMSRLLGVFNYDQTGSATERDALYFEGNDVPWNERLLRVLMSVASDHAGRDGFPREFTTNPSLGGTDAYVFLPGRFQGSGITSAEIPATTVFTSAWGIPQEVKQTVGWRSPAWPDPGKVRVDYDRYYHSSGDTPENTTDRHADGMARCARVVAIAIFRLMG